MKQTEAGARPCQERRPSRRQITAKKSFVTEMVQSFFLGGISRARTYDLHDVNVAL